MIQLFEQYQIEDIYTNLTLGEILKGLEDIDKHVEEQWLGSLEEAKEKKFFGQPIPSIIEKEGYWVIPMGESGIAFDCGDTNSDGIQLVNCVPFGESKEKFRKDLLDNLKAIEQILS